MSAFVLIIHMVSYYGVAVTSVPFVTAEACLAARDDFRSRAVDRVRTAECYGTGVTRSGRIDR